VPALHVADDAAVGLAPHGVDPAERRRAAALRRSQVAGMVLGDGARPVERGDELVMPG
jgi:hypothetical protein